MQAPGTAASMTWTFSLGQAEALLPDPSIRLMLALLALLDGHGIPGAVLSAPPVTAYLAGLGTPFPLRPAQACVGRAAGPRASRPDHRQPNGSDPAILINPAVQAAIRLAAPAPILEDAARASANALLESWPADEPLPWTADRMRANAASLHSAASDTLWSGGCHPLLLRAGRSLDGARLVGPALQHWRELAVRCDSKLGPDHPDSLAVADHLADAYVAAGDATQAVPWYQRLVTQRAREFPVGASRCRRGPRQPGPCPDHGRRPRRRGHRTAADGCGLRALSRPRPSRYSRRRRRAGRGLSGRGRHRGGDPAADAHAG